MKTLSDLRIDFTTAAGGGVTVTGDVLKGLLYAIEWIDGDLADGVDAVFSTILTGSGVDQTLLTLTNANDDDWYYPRATTHDEAGAENIGMDYLILNGTVQVAVTSGGDTKTGGCVIWYWKL